MAGILIALFVYAGFFAYNTHAVSCIYVKMYGRACPTCGITRAFSEILHVNFRKAYSLNTLAPWLFAFFFIQLLLRPIINIMLAKAKSDTKIIRFDIVCSIFLFIVCFYRLISLNFQ